MPLEPEIRLGGGWVNEVIRAGDTVRRSAGPWTPAVHALLRHLEAKGFAAAPRALGYDKQGREVLTYIEGDAVPDEPWIPELLTDEGLREVTLLLRRYHEAVADFTPPRDAVWRVGAIPMQPGEIVRHGDFAPWNIVWRDGKPAGLIDWDFAEPGPALLDLGYLAWNAIPLRGEERLRLVGFETRPDLANRLRVLCEGYGAYPPNAVIDAVFKVAQVDIGRTRELGRRGIHPWSRFLAEGNAEAFETEMAWLEAEKHKLL